MPLEGTDILEALIPDLARYQLRRQFLRLEKLALHPHDEHVFVVRAVEDADAPALRQRAGRPPEEVVIELFGARRLERIDVAALRIDAGHHMLDGAILAGGIHCLEDDQERPAILRVEPLLQLGEALDVTRKQLARALLV